MKPINWNRKRKTTPSSPLQQAQQEWAWNKAQILGQIANLERVSNQLGYKFDFKSLAQDLTNLNNARFITKGGHINK